MDPNLAIFLSKNNLKVYLWLLYYVSSLAKQVHHNNDSTLKYHLLISCAWKHKNLASTKKPSGETMPLLQKPSGPSLTTGAIVVT